MSIFSLILFPYIYTICISILLFSSSPPSSIILNLCDTYRVHRQPLAPKKDFIAMLVYLVLGRHQRCGPMGPFTPIPLFYLSRWPVTKSFYVSLSAQRNLIATRKHIMKAQVNSLYYVLLNRHIISRATLVHILPTSGSLSLRKPS